MNAVGRHPVNAAAGGDRATPATVRVVAVREVDTTRPGRPGWSTAPHGADPDEGGVGSGDGVVLAVDPLGQALQSGEAVGLVGQVVVAAVAGGPRPAARRPRPVAPGSPSWPAPPRLGAARSRTPPVRPGRVGRDPSWSALLRELDGGLRGAHRVGQILEADAGMGQAAWVTAPRTRYSRVRAELPQHDDDLARALLIGADELADAGRLRRVMGGCGR